MSAYKIIELVGTSGKSWEDAAQQAVASASKSLRNLRIAEVIQQDATIDAKGKIKEYRVKLSLSFKYEG
jgi:flavin-binding protein dodecin